jgi:hypothetical protein
VSQNQLAAVRRIREQLLDRLKQQQVDKQEFEERSRVLGE